MKVRNIFTVAMAGAIALTLAACGMGSGSSDHKVSIEGYRRVVDCDENPAVSISLVVTNDSEDTWSMVNGLSVEVCQNGGGCPQTDCPGTDSDAVMADLKAGESREIALGFEVSSFDDIEVQVYEHDGAEKTLLAEKTFSVK